LKKFKFSTNATEIHVLLNKRSQLNDFQKKVIFIDKIVFFSYICILKTINKPKNKPL